MKYTLPENGDLKYLRAGRANMPPLVVLSQKYTVKHIPQSRQTTTAPV